MGKLAAFTAFAVVVCCVAGSPAETTRQEVSALPASDDLTSSRGKRQCNGAICTGTSSGLSVQPCPGGNCFPGGLGLGSAHVSISPAGVSYSSGGQAGQVGHGPRSGGYGQENEQGNGGYGQGNGGYGQGNGNYPPAVCRGSTCIDMGTGFGNIGR